MSQGISAAKAFLVRHWRRLVSGLALALFLLLLLRQDPATLWAAWRQIPWRALVLAGLCFALGQVFNALRWYALVRARHPGFAFRHAVGLYWAGNFTGNLISSHTGGDGYRALAAYALLRNKELALTSVFLDRMVNVASMTMLLPVSLWVFRDALRTHLALLGPGAALLPSFPIVEKIRRAVRLWRQQPRAFLWAFAAAWPSNLIPMYGTYILARALGMPVNYLDIVAAQTATYWLSLGGWLGMLEMSHLAVYPWVGATTAQAGILALVTRGLYWFISLPGALLVSVYLQPSSEARAQSTAGDAP